MFEKLNLCKANSAKLTINLPTEEDAQAQSDFDTSVTDLSLSEDNSSRGHHQHSRERSKSSTSRSASTSRSSKSTGKRRSSSYPNSRSDSGSDSEVSRHGLSTELHANRQRQRLLQSKENMAPATRHGKKRTPSAGKGSQKEPKRRRGDYDSEANDEDLEAMERENERLRAESIRLKTRLSLEARGGKENRNDAEKAMARMVTKRTKQHLFKRCKFIKNDKKLIKATKYAIICFFML